MTRINILAEPKSWAQISSYLMRFLYFDFFLCFYKFQYLLTIRATSRWAHNAAYRVNKIRFRMQTHPYVADFRPSKYLDLMGFRILFVTGLRFRAPHRSFTAKNTLHAVYEKITKGYKWAV